MRKLVPENLNEGGYCNLPSNRNPRGRGGRNKLSMPKRDLMKEEGAVAKQLIPLIGKIDDFRGDADGLRQAFYDVLEDPATSISDAKKEEYIEAASGLGYGRLAKLIADIALAGGGLGVSDYY